MGSILTNISEKDYRALEAESFSSIKALLKGPKEYFYYKETPFKGNVATDFGTAIHHLLQGNKHLIGFCNRTNKTAFTEYEKIHMETVGEEGIILSLSYKDKFEAIEKAFRNEIQIPEIVSLFAYEVALEAMVEDVRIKGKVDGLANGSILEIKTYGQGSGLEDFRRIAYSRHYDMQAYMYCMLSNSTKHYTLAVSTSEPYSIGMYMASEEYLDSGRKKFAIALARYKKYVVNKESYETQFEEL